MLKKLASSIALAAVTALTPIVASAGQIQTVKGGFRYLDAPHSRLVEAILRTGVSVQVNVGNNCNVQNDGIYKPQQRILGVCQDNAPNIHWSEVQWTANDLDTLRHEAVHLIQDCEADGRPGDYVELYFDTEEQRVDFIRKALTKDQVEMIVETYAAGGADEFTIWMELEAFAIAATVGPDSIAKVMDRVCR